MAFCGKSVRILKFSVILMQISVHFVKAEDDNNIFENWDPEFYKDISTLATESIQESSCDGSIFIFTEECSDYISFATEAMSSWAPPVILVNYETYSKNSTSAEISTWARSLRPCSLILICDISQSQNISTGFLETPKLIRHFDQVLYFTDFTENGYSRRISDEEKSILKYTEVFMGVRVINKTYGSESLMKIASICTYCRNSTDSSSNSEDLGTWQRNRTMLRTFFEIFKFQKEASFHDYRFRIGYLNYKPHFHCYYKLGVHGRICSGVEWQMLEAISESLRFSFDLLNYTEAGHGVIYDHESGNITGTIGALRNDTIDFAVGGVSVSPERTQSVDFTKIFAHEPIVFVVEKRNDIYILGIWLAFQPEVWPLIILTIISISILFKFIMKRRYDLSLTQAFQLTVSSILGQPLTHPYFTRDVRLLMKLILGVWWFVCITIGILYNTSLITSLINPVSPKEPESLRDLLQLGYKFVLGCKQGVVYDLLRDDHAAFKMIRERIVLNSDDVSSGLVAYVMEESAVEEIDWTQKHGFRNIQIITERLFLTGYGWGIKSDAPYKEKIDTALGHLASAGLIDHWYSLYTHEAKERTIASKFRLREKIGQIHLNLEILQGAFIFLLLGCGLAGMVFLAELWHKNYTFRFLTVQEIIQWYHRCRHKVNIQRRIIRVGFEQSIIVTPQKIPEGTRKENGTSGGLRHRPELIYLK